MGISVTPRVAAAVPAVTKQANQVGTPNPRPVCGKSQCPRKGQHLLAPDVSNIIPLPGMLLTFINTH